MITPWELYRSCGWSAKRIWRASKQYRPRNWLRYWSQKRAYLATGTDEKLIHSPCITDWSSHMPMEPIYYYQDSWAFERIVDFKPARHVDIGSHHKFVALLSKVVPTVTVDIRPLELQLDSLQFMEGSILDLPFEDGSCECVSSICVVEHIGLGRYGDPIDRDGTIKAAKELTRVLAPGGRLLISVPISEENCVYFNAHRSFQEETILSYFEPLKVTQKRYIYGGEFGDKRQSRNGTGLYELTREA